MPALKFIIELTLCVFMACGCIFLLCVAVGLILALIKIIKRGGRKNGK